MMYGATKGIHSSKSYKTFTVQSIRCTLITLTLLMQLQGTECQNPSFNNSWYIFSERGKTWDVNQRTCRNQGGDLVSIETRGEWMFINKEIRKRFSFFSSKFYHIGLERKADMWTWLSGRPLTICHWEKNPPTPKRDVAVILKVSTSDKQCIINFFRRNTWAAYICEISNVTGQNSSQTYYQEYVEVPCTLEYGNKSWVQNCNFTSYTCKMNCTVTSCEHVSNNISFEVCGQNCSHTNTLLVDQCSEQIHEGGYHTCNVTEYNLTIGKKEFASEKAYYCEGGQCNLKCNGIRCTQICKEGEDDLLISTGTSSSSTSPVAVSASTESAWTQPSPQPSFSSSPSPANEYVSKFDRIEIIRSSSLQLTAEDETILQIIANVGLSFSITGILLTIIMYSFITDVRQPLSQIRLSFSVSLGAGQIIFLAGIKATENRASCVTAAVLSQYFLMAAFCWMMVEGVYLYLFAMKVYNIGDKMHTYHIISWGFPIVMVGISLSVAAGKDGIQSYTSDKYCWLPSTNNLIWIFVAFVALIEVFNILIIIRVHKEMSTLVQPMVEDKRFQQLRLSKKTCVVMVPLLGVTWLFGLLLPLHKAFAYIFTLLNSTQGFMIFALHCMRNSQIRERFKRRMNTISPYAVDGNFTKKGSHVNLGDAGNVWTVELQSFNN